MWSKDVLQWASTYLPRTNKDVLEKLWVLGQQSHCVQGSRGYFDFVKKLHCQGYWMSPWRQCLPWRLGEDFWALNKENAEKVANQKMIMYNLMSERAKIWANIKKKKCPLQGWFKNYTFLLAKIRTFSLYEKSSFWSATHHLHQHSSQYKESGRNGWHILCNVDE